MKTQTTRKAIKATSPNLVRVGYCELASLLKYHQPNQYTAGTYGWNFDVYEVHGVTICTGYRNMPGRKANNAREYDSKAYRIVCAGLTKEDEEQQLEALLVEFCAQA